MRIKLSCSSKMPSLKKRRKQMKDSLIGFIILSILPLLSSCADTEVVYVELPLEPIDCIEHIKTPLDMAKCLNEYKLRDERRVSDASS